MCLFWSLEKAFTELPDLIPDIPKALVLLSHIITSLRDAGTYVVLFYYVINVQRCGEELMGIICVYNHLDLFKKNNNNKLIN